MPGLNCAEEKPIVLVALHDSDSVISPALCNLYTHDSMEGVEGKHTEYADDVNLWTSNRSRGDNQ